MNEDNPFRDNADLIRAIEDAPPRGDIQIPQHVLFKLERTRSEALARSGVLPAADPNQARSQTSRSAKGLVTAARRTPLLAWAAVITLLGLITWLVIPHSTPTAHVTITSPGDLITSTQPIIAWTNKDKPGQKYDVWILPAEGDHLKAPTLFKAEHVTSPVTFAALKPGQNQAATALQPGTDYRVLVCLADAGRTAGVPVPFKVKLTAP